MDINQRRAFMSGDYGHHSRFLDAVLSSLEANLLSFTYVSEPLFLLLSLIGNAGTVEFQTNMRDQSSNGLSCLFTRVRLWNYNTTNDNTHGDHWNGEDFSIFSLDSPQCSPDPNQRRSPGSDSRATLRQQAPNFAKEVMKRSAASNAEFSSKMQIRRAGEENAVGGELQEKRHSQEDDAEDRASNDEGTIADDSPFDRSYFRFEDEESDDSRHHISNVGGRALDAVVVG